MDSIIHNLNYDFNFQLHLLNVALENLSSHDKNLAIAWANKLKSSGASVQEASLRNDLLYHLVNVCKSGTLKNPFNQKPPSGPLLTIHQILPNKKSDRTGAVSTDKGPQKFLRKAEIFQKSPDKGAFLAAQPVPRCGAFCYLAVISKTPEHH